jgi:osmotically-inducible protein OsmY
MSLPSQHPAFWRNGIVLTLLFSLAGCAMFGNDPRARTPGTVLDDEVLESVVKREIRASDPGFESAHLSVVSYNGVVLLAGQVATEKLKLAAERATQKIPKVRRVHNELEVSGPISFMARSNDSWLTTKVKSKLVANRDAPGRKVKVVTENGVVYLLGILPRDQADAAVDSARNVYGVQKIVKVFEYLD